MTALAPSAQKPPSSHGKHIVAPAPSWNIPAGHLAQRDCPPVEYVPGLHKIGSVVPGGHKDPGGQGRHADAPAVGA